MRRLRVVVGVVVVVVVVTFELADTLLLLRCPTTKFRAASASVASEILLLS